MAIHIVTDSASCLPVGYADQHGVTVVPLKVALGGAYYRDGVEISGDEFYRQLAAGVPAATTQPSPDDFALAYRTILEKDSAAEILSIHLSSRLSGTLNAALTGRNQLETAHVRLVDTWNVGLGIGFPVMRAVELVEAGAPLWKVAAEAESLCLRTYTYCILGSLQYVERGGRIGRAAAIVGSILKIKPILIFREGSVDIADRPRTKKVAVDHLWSLIDRHLARGAEYVGFHYAANRPEVEELQQEFMRRYQLPSFCTQLGPVVGTYSGPDMIGLVICEKKSSP